MMKTSKAAGGASSAPGQPGAPAAAAAARPLGLYIHIPFCLKKCGYCDFYSVAGEGKQAYGVYVDALLREAEYYGRAYRSRAGRAIDGFRALPGAGSKTEAGVQVDTVFIGGGTPSILPGEEILRLMEGIGQVFHLTPEAEITIECNPATLTEEKLSRYRQAGINRISMGVQSLEPEVLSVMGRAHSRQDVFDSWEKIRAAGFTNCNLDLMFGVPGQTMDMWRETVEQVLRLSPEHLSFYSLELSQGTEFYRKIKNGQLKETSQELDRSMYHFLLDQMEEADYLQYEISNGGKPGYQCRHNLKYWNLDEYLGLGAGAHSYVNHTRHANEADWQAYTCSWTGAERGGTALSASPSLAWEEKNSLMDDITDFTFTALRKTQGIDLREFENRFGVPFWDIFAGERQRLEPYIQRGQVESGQWILRITKKGMDVANGIISLFLGIHE